MTGQINLDTRGVLQVKDVHGNNVKIVIKLAGKGYGNGRIIGNKQVQVCRYVATINDRKSAAQLARRKRFKAAVAAWQALPQEERQRLHQEAKRYNQTGWNRYLSQALK